MIAFSDIEPWGALADDYRAGQICATVANVNRNPEHQPEAWTASDFMPALAAARERAAPPILVLDPDEQARLLDRALFGGSR